MVPELRATDNGATPPSRIREGTLTGRRIPALRFDVKTLESAPRLEPFHVNSLDDRAVGASMQPSKEVSQGLRVSLHNDLRRPIRVVAHRPHHLKAAAPHDDLLPSTSARWMGRFSKGRLRSLSTERGSLGTPPTLHRLSTSRSDSCIVAGWVGELSASRPITHWEAR
jgi:hypothetical protein